MKRKKKNLKEMTFLDHMEELRTRLIIILIAVALCAVAGWFISMPVLDYVKSLSHVKLQALSPQTPFMVRMKISLVLGVALSCPIIFTEIWLFVAPGLYPHEKKYALPTIFVAVILFLVGGAMGLYSVPLSLRFFENFGGGVVEFNYTLDKFVSFISGFVLSFGFVFETPLVLFFLAKIGVVNYKFLAKNRKYAILITMAAAAVVTPSVDVLSMLILFIPLYLLYEASLFMIRFTKPGRRIEK